MFYIEKIYIDYLVNPVGVDHSPQISWKIISDKRDFLQTAYRIKVALDDDFLTCIYDSQVIEGQDSAHVILDKDRLESLKRYYVKVCVCNQENVWSEWSPCGSFVTAFLDRSEMDGSFISVEEEVDADYMGSFEVRASLSLPEEKEIQEAYLCSSALGLYQIYVNGTRANDFELSPGWTSYHKHLMYQVSDVTHLLQEGQNIIGAEIGAGWYKGLMGFIAQKHNYGKHTGLWVELVVRYTDGSISREFTNPSWKGRKGPIEFAEIYDGEIYDARKENVGWLDREYIEDNQWKKANEIGIDKKIMSAQEGGQVKCQEEIKVQKLWKTPQGDLVIDFGQNMAGWIEVSLGETQGGEKVQLHCFETLDKEGNVYLDNLRKAKQTTTYIAKKEKSATYRPHFTYQGFRYAKIESFPGKAKADNFKAIALYSDMPSTGSFQTDHPLVNRLQQNIEWGLRSNFVDIPTDCPQRNERMGWTGDAQIFCRTASYIRQTYTFFRKWLKDVACDQTPEGGVPHVVPDTLTGKTFNDKLLSQGTHSAAAWGDVAVINPWTMYLVYGDQEILKDQYESMKAWIDFMTAHSEDGIWNYRLQFGDWVALDAKEGSYYGATPNELTCTAYYAYSTNIFAQVAEILGNKKDAVSYSKLHTEIVDSFRRHFFDEKGHMIAKTQTAHILALHFDLVADQYRQKTVDALIKLLKKEKGHLVTGFVGTPYFCHALSANGHKKEAYDLLLKEDFPSWLYQVKMGATTVWEHWDGIKPDGCMWSPDMNSFNHYAYGAIGEWMYRVVLGLDTDMHSPGYKQAIIAPKIGGFSWAEGSYESIYGKFHIRWEQKEESVSLDVEIPANTKALIILETDKELFEDDNIDFIIEDGNSKAMVGSGKYHFVYSKQEAVVEQLS